MFLGITLKIFEFVERVSKEGLKEHTEEDDLVPFNVSFPMDMLIEQKCLNIGDQV